MNKVDSSFHAKIVNMDKKWPIKTEECLALVVSECPNSNYAVVYLDDLLNGDIEILDYLCAPDEDDCLFVDHFSWYPEYGFVKMGIRNVDTWDENNRRMYFDRQLYEQKKAELHPNN